MWKFLWVQRAITAAGSIADVIVAMANGSLSPTRDWTFDGYWHISCRNGCKETKSLKAKDCCDDGTLAAETVIM